MTPRWKGKSQVFTECKAPHPTDENYFCKRVEDHDGAHQAYVFSVIKPDEWEDAPTTGYENVSIEPTDEPPF